MFQLSDMFALPKPVIGMLHIAALPGAPRYDDNLPAVRERLLHDLDALQRGGVHGLMLENYGDVPFYPERVPATVVAHMTALTVAVRERSSLPLGINMLRNDGRSALAVAHAAGADFIRVNVLCGARVTDQGIISGIAHDLLRERAALGAQPIRIFADVNVKHSAPLAPRSPADETADMIHRGGADALIVSGAATGIATDVDEIEQVAAAAGDTPVLVGSGVSAESLPHLVKSADGFIVGTSVKRDGVVGNPVDVARVAALMDAHKRSLL